MPWPCFLVARFRTMQCTGCWPWVLAIISVPRRSKDTSSAQPRFDNRPFTLDRWISEFVRGCLRMNWSMALRSRRTSTSCSFFHPAHPYSYLCWVYGASPWFFAVLVFSKLRGCFRHSLVTPVASMCARRYSSAILRNRRLISTLHCKFNSHFWSCNSRQNHDWLNEK